MVATDAEILIELERERIDAVKAERQAEQDAARDARIAALRKELASAKRQHKKDLDALRAAQVERDDMHRKMGDLESMLIRARAKRSRSGDRIRDAEKGLRQLGVQV